MGCSIGDYSIREVRKVSMDIGENIKLKKILNIFQEAYVERAVNKIDSFMEALFDKNEDVVIIGTSDSEWCLNHEEVRNILISDWKYWGDIEIKSDEALTVLNENTALIYVPGTVKYTFNSNDDTYARYLGFVKEYFDEAYDDSRKSDREKLTEINWLLCHLLSQRDSNERSYLWDLRISFVLIKKESRWIIKYMQFSLPTSGFYPDVRIDKINYSMDSYNKDLKKVGEYASLNKSPYKDEILKLLKNFNNDYMDVAREASEITGKYITSCNPLIVNTGCDICESLNEANELIKKHKSYYDEITLNYDNCLIFSNENTAWVAASGLMKKNIEEMDALENTTDIIKEIFNSDLDDKDKLFTIRRRIADTLKENAKGAEYVWPFRFEGMLIKEGGAWLFKYIQFSLPFSTILEGKTDAATCWSK